MKKLFQKSQSRVGFRTHKCGFATAIVLIFLMVASFTLLMIYDVVVNYRQNTIRVTISSQLETDALNILNVAIGFLRLKSSGILGFSINFNDLSPSWFGSDFLNKLDVSWKKYVQEYVNSTKAYKMFTIGTSNYGLDSSILNELINYKNNRQLENIEIYAFSINSLNVFVLSRVKKENYTAYSYGIIGSKLLNQFIYFTNKEKLPNGATIYFTAKDTMDGPLRTHDYINVNNVGGKPTFTSTVELFGIKDQNGNIIQPSNYSVYTNLLGNPPYKLLTQQDAEALNFQTIKVEYKTNVNNLVKTYNDIRNNPNTMTGLKFFGPVTVSFNSSSGSSYDVMIQQETTSYIIKWESSGPPLARIRKQGGGLTEEFVFNFNGVIYSTGDLTVDNPNSALSRYRGNFTLYSENDILLKDRLIPDKTFQTFFTNAEGGNDGLLVDQQKITQIKAFLSNSETSSLNLVAEKNVRIGQKLNNMKIFASVFAFDGSFGVDGYNTGNANGQLFLTGSIMQNTRGPVGTFNPNTGQPVTGYYKTYVYDPRITTGAYQPIGTPSKSSTIRLFVLGVVK